MKELVFTKDSKKLTRKLTVVMTENESVEFIGEQFIYGKSVINFSPRVTAVVELERTVEELKSTYNLPENITEAIREYLKTN